MDNKTFIDIFARRSGLTRKDSSSFAEALGKEIGEVCIAGNIAVLPGFGSFETKKKMERVMAVPSSSGRRLLIPPKIVMTLKPSAVLKQRLNEVKSEQEEEGV